MWKINKTPFDRQAGVKWTTKKTQEVYKNKIPLEKKITYSQLIDYNKSSHLLEI